MSEGMTELHVVALEQCCEVFCDACGQLRLWARLPEQPKACGGCGSDRLTTGPLCGEELAERRRAWQVAARVARREALFSDE